MGAQTQCMNEGDVAAILPTTQTGGGVTAVTLQDSPLQAPPVGAAQAAPGSLARDGAAGLTPTFSC